MQFDDAPIDEIDENDEAFLAEALADLDIPEDGDADADDAFVHVSVDDVLAMTSTSVSTTSSPPRQHRRPGSPGSGSSVGSPARNGAGRRRRKSNSTSSSSRSSRSHGGNFNVVGTMEAASSSGGGDGGGGGIPNTDRHTDSSHSRRHVRDVFADVDASREPPEPSPSTPLADDDFGDSIYLEETPSRTPAVYESSGATTPVQQLHPNKRDALSKSSPNVLEEAANAISAEQHGEASVGSRTLEDNAANGNTHQDAPNALDTSLIMTDEDFLAEMAEFGAEESGVDDGFEGQDEYRGEGAEEINGVGGDGDPQSDSELLLMEEESAERARRVRQLANTRAKSSTSVTSAGSDRNNELSRSTSSTSAPGRSKTPQRGRLDTDTALSSFGGSNLDGGLLYSDDELSQSHSKTNGYETPNGTFGRSVSNGGGKRGGTGIVEFSQELAHMHNELEATRTAYNKSNVDNDQLHSTISILQNEKQALLHTISQLDAKIAETKRASEDEIEKHRKAYDDLSSESVVFRGRIELLETENLRFRDKEKVLREQFQSEAELAKTLREQLDGLQQDHDDLMERFDQVVKDYDTVSDDFDRLKSVATSQLQNAGELYSERVRELNQTRSELSEVASQRDTTRLELEEAVNNLNSQQALRNKFQERAQHFEEINQQLEHERDSLHEKLSEARRTVEQMSSELQGAVQLKEQFMNELIEQKEEASRLHDQLDEQESGRGRTAELEESMAGLAAENRALKSRLFDDSEAIRKLQEENGELLSYVDQLLKESNR